MDRCERLLAEIVDEVRWTASFTGRSELQPRVLDALRTVSRQEFVPADLQLAAYANQPLPIGEGQTISQPYIVALMTDLLDTKASDVVLEIGTGSGYQAALLALLVKKVYSVEIIASLSKDAAARLQRLAYDNIELKVGDGNHGWPEHAPYDGIIVTAAAPFVPPALLQQLKANGRMIIPIGAPHAAQVLTLITKDAKGEVMTRNVLDVAFVPLVSGAKNEASNTLM